MESSTYADILFFALVAGFILFKLFHTLGRKDDTEQRVREKEAKRRREAQEKVGASQQKAAPPIKDITPEAQAAEAQAAVEAKVLEGASSAVKRGVESIRKASPIFSVAEFLQGASAAFEMVLEAFNTRDRSTLKALFSPQLFKAFVETLDAQEKAQAYSHTTLISLKEAELASASMKGKIAQVEVAFTSEQISVTKDAEGKVVGGDPSDVETITDHWVFERDIRSTDPNWTIVAT